MTSSVEILLVEDNPGDIRLLQEVLKEGDFTYGLSIAKDGEEALDFLYNRNGFEKAGRPSIIFLDLNLPKKDGREVLAVIKKEPALRSIPVVVLTTSSAEEDIAQTYDLGVNCFVTKPVEYERFVEVIRTLMDFWFRLVKLPT